MESVVWTCGLDLAVVSGEVLPVLARPGTCEPQPIRSGMEVVLKLRSGTVVGTAAAATGLPTTVRAEAGGWTKAAVLKEVPMVWPAGTGDMTRLAAGSAVPGGSTAEEDRRLTERRLAPEASSSQASTECCVEISVPWLHDLSTEPSTRGTTEHRPFSSRAEGWASIQWGTGERLRGLSRSAPCRAETLRGLRRTGCPSAQ
mmetsp:Transcript_52571/g.152838  ORF Transcript_52571/g.152838 Transcript_52571/m.152838 type:complete len:201 (+) Transcript_52571:363-965(+)